MAQIITETHLSIFDLQERDSMSAWREDSGNITEKLILYTLGNKIK